MQSRRHLMIAVSAIAVAGVATRALADEAYAKNKMKAMSDYMATQKTISFDYDADLEIVTSDHQKLMLANSEAPSCKQSAIVRSPARCSRGMLR
jgi:hypothetical protein